MVYLARRSQAGSSALCAVRWLCCSAVAVRYLHGAWREMLGFGGGSWRGGAQAALVAALWAV